MSGAGKILAAGAVRLHTEWAPANALSLAPDTMSQPFAPIGRRLQLCDAAHSRVRPLHPQAFLRRAGQAAQLRFWRSLWRRSCWRRSVSPTPEQCNPSFCGGSVRSRRPCGREAPTAPGLAPDVGECQEAARIRGGLQRNGARSGVSRTVVANVAGGERVPAARAESSREVQPADHSELCFADATARSRIRSTDERGGDRGAGPGAFDRLPQGLFGRANARRADPPVRRGHRRQPFAAVRVVRDWRSS